MKFHFPTSLMSSTKSRNMELNTEHHDHWILQAVRDDRIGVTSEGLWVDLAVAAQNTSTPRGYVRLVSRERSSPASRLQPFDVLQGVAQKAMDLGYDGWMIESHLEPDKALSDAAQQVTPEALVEMLASILVRQAQSDDLTFVHELQTLRSRMDKVDEEIIHLLGKRMRIAEELGRFKKEESITIFQIDRWKEILESRTMLAEQVGLSKEFILKYLEQLHKESIRTQTRVMNKRD